MSHLDGLALRREADDLLSHQIKQCHLSTHGLPDSVPDAAASHLLQQEARVRRCVHSHLASCGGSEKLLKPSVTQPSYPGKSADQVEKSVSVSETMPSK